MVLTSHQVFAVNDIKCTISKVAHDGIKEEIIKNKAIAITDKWYKFDVTEQDEMAVGCSTYDVLLRCGVFISEKGQLAKNFETKEQMLKNGMWVASDGFVELIAKNYSVVCSSTTLFEIGANSASNAKKKKMRALSKNELDFCQRFWNFAGDNRLLCLSVLQVLEKPVPPDQLDFCSRLDNSAAEGLGIDTRLLCIKKVSSGN